MFPQMTQKRSWDFSQITQITQNIDFPANLPAGRQGRKAAEAISEIREICENFRICMMPLNPVKMDLGNRIPL